MSLTFTLGRCSSILTHDFDPPIYLNDEIEYEIDLNTFKVTIKTNRRINFGVDNTIGSLLGFRKRMLNADEKSVSDHQVKILNVNTICVDCNLAIGSYLNGEPVHLIHQFNAKVPTGYKIIESPVTILYYPVSVKTINNITVKIIDQSGNIIDFREEEITVRLHLRKKDL